MRITTAAHDSALGTWSHSECEPSRLRGIVEKLWHFEGKTSLLRERSFPKVYSEIIVHLGPRFRDVSECATSLDLFPTTCFGGPTTTPFVIEAPDATCCVIGIQLTPAGAFQLLRTPPTGTINSTLDVVDALAPDAKFLAEACYTESSVAQRFELICNWITRLFREQVGLAPKQYARILRFRRSLSLLRQGRRLSDAALSAGYYDQAHLHRDFAEFARRTPLEFVTATRFPNSLSIPE